MYINYGSLKKKKNKPYVRLWHVCLQCMFSFRNYSQTMGLGEQKKKKKIKAAYEIVIHCFKICTVLQNQEL